MASPKDPKKNSQKFIKVPMNTCTRCKSQWAPRSVLSNDKKKWIPKKLKKCPVCRSQYWDKEKKLNYEHWKTKNKSEEKP